MLKRLSNLSIRHSIFLTTFFIVVFSLLISNAVTFSRFSTAHDDLVETTSREINKQIIMNFENYIDNITDSAHFLQIEILRMSKHNNYSGLSQIFENTKTVNRHVETIVLFNQDGVPILATEPHSKIRRNIDESDWFIQTLTDDSIFHFAPPTRKSVVLDSFEEVVSVSRVVEYYRDGEKLEGVLLLDLSTDDIRAIAAQTNLGDTGHIIFIDANQNLVFSSIASCYDNTCDSVIVANEITLGGEHIEQDNTAMYANVNTLKYTRWKIATFIDVDAISETRKLVLYTTVLIVGASLLMTLLMASMLSKRMSGPLDTLKKHMEQFQKGKLDKKINLKGQKEIVALSDTFNMMADEINALMDKVYQEQRAKRKSEFIALQNQINPHFLYNTLDSILYLSEQGENHDVQTMVAALSKFFRISISNESGLVSLRDEIEHVKSYLRIQQIRYRQAFEFNVTLDESIADYKVLKISLQPLAENAISHGINPDHNNNDITIHAYPKDDTIVISIKNSGYGISETQIKTMYAKMHNEMNSSSIGLKNVYQRLQLHFGSTADLVIESEMDHYTEVKMIIPMERKGEVI